MSKTKIFFSISVMVLSLAFAGCAVSDLINILNSGNEPIKPKWDYEFKAPLIDMDKSLNGLLTDTIDLKSMIKDIGNDAELDDSSADGVLRIKYKIDFPTVDDLADSTLKNDISATFNNSPFNYTTPSLPAYEGLGAFWPLPSQISQEEDDCLYYDFATAGADVQNIYVDMKSGTVNKDLNKDGSDDLLFKGISDPTARIYFYISLLKDGTPVKALKNGQITINEFALENINCSFVVDPSNDYDSEGLTEKLGYYTNLPNPLYFNGYINTIDSGDPFRFFDVTKFKLRITTSNEYTSFFPAITPVPKAQGNLKIRLTTKIVLGDKIYILGPLYPISFDMGLSEFDGIKSLTDFFDKAPDPNQTEIDRLTNKLISSISLGNMTLVLDATNDLPFAIDLKKMFNNKTNFKNLGSYYEDTAPVDQNLDPTSDSTIKKDLWDSGMFAFFDRDKNNVRDTYSLLKPDRVNGAEVNENSFLIPGDSGRTTLRLENINGFFQIPDAIDNPQKYLMPESVYFGKCVDLRSTGDASIDISLFSKKDLIKLGASIELPISLRLFETTDDIDILKALMGDADLGSQIKDMTSFIPIGNIGELGLDMEIENGFPFGMSFSFDLIVDKDDLVNKKTVSLLLGSGAVRIESGNITLDPEGLYVATANTKNNIKLGIKNNFTYKDVNDETKTYDGDLIKLINESKTLGVSMKFNFLPTIYDGKNVDVVLSTKNAIKLKLNAYGKAKFDVSKLF